MDNLTLKFTLCAPDVAFPSKVAFAAFQIHSSEYLESTGGGEGSEWPAYDLEQAKALLAEAGFPDGFETTITYRDVVRGYLPEPGVVAQDIQSQLKDLGITAEIVVMESGAFIDAANGGQIEGIHLLG